LWVWDRGGVTFELLYGVGLGTGLLLQLFVSELEEGELLVEAVEGLLGLFSDR
jgi:hypothetical protein